VRVSVGQPPATKPCCASRHAFDGVVNNVGLVRAQWIKDVTLGEG